MLIVTLCNYKARLPLISVRKLSLGGFAHFEPTKVSNISATVDEILCMYKLDRRIQFCFRNLRITCNASHVFSKPLGELKLKLKQQRQGHTTFRPILSGATIPLRLQGLRTQNCEDPHKFEQLNLDPGPPDQYSELSVKNCRKRPKSNLKSSQKFKKMTHRIGSRIRKLLENAESGFRINADLQPFL